MPDLLQIFSSLKAQMSETRSRSDVLRALIWPLGILGTITVSLAAWGPFWLQVLFALFFALCLLLYLGAYAFCLVKDRDALRSEKYALNKYAIQQGVLGDSETGVFDAEDDQSPPAVVIEQNAKRIEHKS